MARVQQVGVGGKDSRPGGRRPEGIICDQLLRSEESDAQETIPAGTAGWTQAAERKMYQGRSVSPGSGQSGARSVRRTRRDRDRLQGGSGQRGAGRELTAPLCSVGKAPAGHNVRHRAKRRPSRDHHGWPGEMEKMGRRDCTEDNGYQACARTDGVRNRAIGRAVLRTALGMAGGRGAGAVNAGSRRGRRKPARDAPPAVHRIGSGRASPGAPRTGGGG